MPAAPRTTLRSLAAPLWLVAMGSVAAWVLMVGPAGRSSFVPEEHAPPPGSHVRVTLEGEAAESAWPQVVDALGPTLPGHWPLAPPPGEVRAWLDAHLLYRLAPADHAALAQRLEPNAMRAVIVGMRSRMASPLFGVGDDDPRRDPLGLRSLSEVEPARYGLWPEDGPSATATGDLLAADGRTLLLYLRTGQSPARLRAWTEAQLASHFGVTSGVAISVLPMQVEASGSAMSASAVARLVAAGLAALVLALALGLRRVRVALALALVVGAGAPLVLALVGGVDGVSAPLLLALLGVAASLALTRGRAALWPALRLGAALLPLALLPYPVWQRWALAWLVGVLVVALAARVVTPTLLRWVAARPPDGPEVRAPRPWPAWVGAVVGLGLLSLGAWSLGHVSGDIPEEDRGDAAVGAEFFAPSRMAELRTTPREDEAAALRAAADDAALLTPLVPEVATHLDAPGAAVLGEEACAARAAGLAPLDLPGRVELLRVLLTEEGMRPDAFGESLRGLDAGRQPTPKAALAGTLSGWFTAHLEGEEAGVVAVSRVALAPELAPEVVLPAALRGPAVFAHAERQARRERLAVALAVGAWLSAFLSWLAVRSLTAALTGAALGVAAQAGALALAVAAGMTSVPLLLPPLLLVGALTADASARACRPEVDAAHPRLVLACQLAAAPVLLLSGDPGWRGFGLLLGFGGVLGFALATRAAPPLRDRLRRLVAASAPRPAREEPR